MLDTSKLAKADDILELEATFRDVFLYLATFEKSRLSSIHPARVSRLMSWCHACHRSHFFTACR